LRYGYLRTYRYKGKKVVKWREEGEKKIVGYLVQRHVHIVFIPKDLKAKSAKEK